jgi:hypothetical protein
MLNLRTFRKIYLQLQEKETQSLAIYSINEHLPSSLEFFQLELKNERDLVTKSELSSIYNKIIQDKYSSVIQSFLRKDYLCLETIFALVSAYIFEVKPSESIANLENYTNQLIKRLNKKTLESGNPEEIINEINYKITQSLILDNSFLGHYNFSEVPNQHIVSQYTLGILILILAEKLQLPIFGLPFSDKLVLCYTENYCTDSELVNEDDIVYYIVIGEKDIIYTLEDLKLLSLLQEETLELKAILPQSSQRIIESWMDHLNQGDFDPKTKFNLSSIYQQIFSLAEEF